MPRDDYEDEEFGDDLYEEFDEFGEEEGFSELDPDEELAEGEYCEEEEELPASQSEQSEEEIAMAAFDEIAAASQGEQDQLAWRETYFILFQKHDRPTLTQVESAVGESGRRLVMEHLQADDDGLFQSVLVQAPEDNAALEISYEQGEAVIEQSAELAKHMQKLVDSEVLAQLLRADARLTSCTLNAWTTWPRPPRNPRTSWPWKPSTPPR